MSSGDITEEAQRGASIPALLGAALRIRFLRGEWPRSCDRKQNLEFEHTLFEFHPIKALKGRAFTVRNAC